MSYSSAHAWPPWRRSNRPFVFADDLTIVDPVLSVSGGEQMDGSVIGIGMERIVPRHHVGVKIVASRHGFRTVCLWGHTFTVKDVQTAANDDGSAYEGPQVGKITEADEAYDDGPQKQ